MTVRIGLVGCGRWGQLILRDLRACGAEVHVVARSDVSVGNARAGGAASIVDDIDRLASMDGYVVASTTITHADAVERIIPRGKPIFVEKPLTADAAAARRIVEAAGERVFVMDKWRYHPAIEAMRIALSEGRIGRALALQCTRLGWSNPHTDVGALWILAPHDLSIAMHLFGTVPPLHRTAALVPGQPELGLTATFRGPGLPVVEITIGTASPQHLRRCLLIGSAGTLELRDGMDTRLFVREGAPAAADARDTSIDVGAAMPLLIELQRFVGHLRGGPPPVSSASEGLLIVERLAAVEAALANEAEPA